MGSYRVAQKRKMETVLPEAIKQGETRKDVWKRVKKDQEENEDKEGDAKMK